MPSNRRRQRSVRITAAVLLLLVAGLVVAAALLIAELVVLAVAAVVALLAGIGAVRLVLGELIQSRRAAAEDRAEQARAYQKLDAARVEESTTFATMMTARLDEANTTVKELQGTLRLAERRAELAEQRARHESRRRGELEARIDELTSQGSPADGGDETASEMTGGTAPYWDPDLPTVVDLLAWEDRGFEPAEPESKADLA